MILVVVVGAVDNVDKQEHKKGFVLTLCPQVGVDRAGHCLAFCGHASRDGLGHSLPVDKFSFVHRGCGQRISKLSDQDAGGCKEGRACFDCDGMIYFVQARNDHRGGNQVPVRCEFFVEIKIAR